MILVDTGAFYALIDKNDVNHKQARDFYERVAGRELLCTSLPVLTETWLLVNARLGRYFADAFWQGVCDGPIGILSIDEEGLRLAFELEDKYGDVGFGFVDATCLALCEKHKIRRVFTYDRKDFSVYAPSFAAGLELLP